MFVTRPRDRFSPSSQHGLICISCYYSRQDEPKNVLALSFLRAEGLKGSCTTASLESWQDTWPLELSETKMPEHSLFTLPTIVT